jgi:hypothetical protein
MRLVAAFACAVMLICLGVLPGHADKRVALVIGNGAYSSAPRLPNPRNDAEDVAAALKRSGFETIVGLDRDQLGMQDVAIRFARAARDSDVAFFYYSGHAVQFGGVNYLMPIDAKLTDESDLRRMTRADEIVADLQQASNVRILVLDSCRDNPLADDLKRSIGLTRAASLQRGLARIDAPQGMIMAYATQAGRTAADGTERNSPYTGAFLRHIESQDEIATIFRRVSADVYETTKHAQLPELSLSLIGEYYLRGKAQPITAQPPPSADPAERAWAVTQNTTSIAVLEDFIRQFGATLYGSMAWARLEELKKSQVAVVGPASPSTASPLDELLITSRSPFLGVTVGNLSRQLAEDLHIGPPTEGVVILNVAKGSTAQKVGFMQGDIIASVNDEKITKTVDLERVTKNPRLIWRVTLISRVGGQLNVVLGPD